MALLALCSFKGMAQAVKTNIVPEGYQKAQLYEGDTMAVVNLREVFIYPQVKFKNKREQAAWLRAREALKNAGVQGVRARHCQVEPPTCGCGAKLDIRDYGPKGKIDREEYFITVPVSQAEKEIGRAHV